MIKEKIIENIGVIYLDRPKQLNALSFEMLKMIKTTLKNWEDDEDIRAVLFDSTIDKAFCAGGDIKEVYTEFLTNEDSGQKDQYFRREFDLDEYVINYKKPIISHWKGVTMGGGVGLSVYTDFIIADETVNWAMPETLLGFTPDVGVGKVISNMPQAIGQYLGLTGTSIETSDLVNLGIVDLFIDSKDYDEVINLLFELSKDYKADELVDKFKEKIIEYGVNNKQTKLTKNKNQIEKYFSKDSIKEIFKKLKDSKDDEFAKNTLEELEKRDPFMLTLQFEKYFACKDLSPEEVLDLDLKIINYAIQTVSMKEGIRAKIIDRDNNPSWPVKTLDDVDMDRVKKLLNRKII